MPEECRDIEIIDKRHNSIKKQRICDEFTDPVTNQKIDVASLEHGTNSKVSGIIVSNEGTMLLFKKNKK